MTELSKPRLDAKPVVGYVAAMIFRRIGRWLPVMWVLPGSAGSALAMPSMSVGTTAGAPGTTDSVPINVTIDTDVVGFQFDLIYKTNYLTPGAPIAGGALSGQQLFYNVVSPGLYRVLAISTTNPPTTLTTGVAVYVPMAIAATLRTTMKCS